MTTNPTEIQQAKKSVEDILSDSLSMFTNHPTKRNLTDKYNDDKSNATGYHGRELLELVQNADDAYVDYKADNGTLNDVLIEYIGNTLRVSNKGKVFVKDAVERLSQGNVSGKSIQYIGNKGIGFRSILNWAKEIHVYSGCYSFGFSKEFANKQFDFLKDNYDNIQREIEDKPGLSFPILWAPYWMEENKKIPGYDTTIEIILDTDKLGDEWSVQKQLEEFDYNILLFLQNISKISIKTDSDYYAFIKESAKEDGMEKCHLKKVNLKDGGKIVDERQYYYFKRDDEEIEIDGSMSLLKMTVAIPCSFEPMESKLYTFFPIKNEACPVPSLLHATFLLDQNRNTIENSKTNTDIYEKLMEFYVSTVIDAFTKKEYGNTVAKLLTPFEFPDKFGGISKSYMKLCAEKLAIMNVNGGFVPLSRKPRIYKDFPSFFKGDKFELLCQSIEDERVSKFLKQLIKENYDYEYDEIRDIINACAEHWNAMQRAECYDWWLKEINADDYTPNLVRDQGGNWITDCEKLVFFPPSEDLTPIPSWNELVLLYREDADALDEVFRKSHSKRDKREVISYLKSCRNLQFKEYSADALIMPLKDAIDGNHERAVDFIRWIWENEKSDGLNDSDKIFPCKDGTVQCATNVYLGEEYGENSFIPFLKAGGKFELESPQNILGKDADEAEIESFRNFLNDFAFVDSPQITKETLRYRTRWNWDCKCSELDKIYAGDAEAKLNDLPNIEGKPGERHILDITVTTIDNIGGILEQIPTVQIFKWILGNNKNSAELRDCLYYSSGTEEIHYLPDPRKSSPRAVNIKIENYLCYAFAYTPWLTLGKAKKKYAPIECKFASRNPLEEELVPEAITDEVLKKLGDEAGVSPADIRFILEKLDCDSCYLSLAPESFYNLLFKLPEIKNVSESIKFSHSIYNNCIQALNKSDYYLDRYIDTPAGENFRENGKLLCKNDRSYKPVKEIFFSNTSVLNPLNKALFDIPLKNGKTDSIVEIFKVSPYDKEWETNVCVSQDDIPKSNGAFKKEWINYIPYILCLFTEAQQSKMIPKFRNLKIDLISRLRDEDGGIVDLQGEEYHLVEDNGHYYIYVGFDEINRYKLSLSIRDLLQKVLDTENEERLDFYAQLFRSDEESRRGLIQEHTYLDALEDCINRFNAANSDGNPIVNYLHGKGIEAKSVMPILNRLYTGVELKVSEQERFADFLRNNGLDVADIRLVLDQENISIAGYNKKLLKAKFEEMPLKRAFEWALWCECRDGDIANRMDFRRRKESLGRDILDVDIDNSVYFNPESKLDEIFKEMFGVFKNEFNFDANKETSCNSVDELYKKNRDALEIPDGVDVDDFLDDSRIKSLLYFDIETVQGKLSEFIERREKEDSDIEQVHVSVPLNTEISYGDVLKVSSSRNPSGGTRVITHSTRSAPKENEVKLQNQGYEAEKVVVNELRKKAIADINQFFDDQDYDVEWKSKAAEYFENTDGDDSLGYDILLRSADGKILYVDVKSHEGEDCSFMMSANEVHFARTHLSDDKDEYRIIFISNFKLGSEDLHPSINVLPANFLDDPKFQKEYPNVRIYLSQL